MNNKDYLYFDPKFNGLYERVNEINEKVGSCNTQIGIISNEVNHIKNGLTCHITKPCKNINDHFRAEHVLSWGRILKATGIIVGILAGITAVISLFVKI